MELKQVCVASLVDSFPRNYIFELPGSALTINNFPSVSTDYVTLPPTDSAYLPAGFDCSQSFTALMTDGS
jgi:hypothetical protein